jgi:predicted nucleotidyltransferase
VSTIFFRLERDRIERSLQTYVRTVADAPNVLAVVLFGSLARGEATAMSDADVVLLLAQSTKPFHARIPDYLCNGVGIPIDVFPYTLAEARQMLEEKGGILSVALSEGIWLFDRGRVREDLMSVLSLIRGRHSSHEDGSDDHVTGRS